MRQRDIKEALIPLSYGVACVSTSVSLVTILSLVIDKASLVFPKKV